MNNMRHCARYIQNNTLVLNNFYLIVLTCHMSRVIFSLAYMFHYLTFDYMCSIKLLLGNLWHHIFSPVTFNLIYMLQLPLSLGIFLSYLFVYVLFFITWSYIWIKIYLLITFSNLTYSSVTLDFTYVPKINPGLYILLNYLWLYK